MLNEDIIDWYASTVAVRLNVDRNKTRVVSAAASQMIMRGQPVRAQQQHLDTTEKKLVPWKTIFEFELLIYPVCWKAHWIIVALHPSQQLLCVFDSMQGNSEYPSEMAYTAMKQFDGYI